MSEEQNQTQRLTSALDTVGKLVGLLKVIVSLIIGAAVWGATLQFQVGANTRAVDEIRADRKASIESWNVWRSTVDQANTRQDTLIAQLASLQSQQQQQIGEVARDARAAAAHRP